MSLSVVANVAQIFSVAIMLPVFLFKVWDKLEKRLNEQSQRLSRIEYALYNDGKTGLVNKVDDLLENQQEIKIDVEVLKVRGEK